MRRGYLTIVAYLLVAAVLASGLVGCSRSAVVREPEATPPSATEAADASWVDEGAASEPGETVVSSITSVPQGREVSAEELATMAADVEGTATATPTATPEAAAPKEPTPTKTPACTSCGGGGKATATPKATATHKPPACTSCGGTVTHTVKKGETLTSIAEVYGTTAQAIAEANNLSDPSMIYPGQVLVIPTSAGSSSGQSGGTTKKQGSASGGKQSSKKPACRYEHVVKKGEWVYKIARKYGVSPKKVLQANGLTGKQANIIHPGRVLCIP